MVSYAKMTDQELEAYRARSRAITEKREKEFKKKHPNGISSHYNRNNYEPYDHPFTRFSYLGSHS